MNHGHDRSRSLFSRSRPLLIHDLGAALVLAPALLEVIRQHTGIDAEPLGDVCLREALVEERGEVGRLEDFLLAAPFPSRHFRSASGCHGLNTRHAE